MATPTWLGRPRLGQSPGSLLGPAPPRPHTPPQSSGTGERPGRPELAPVRLPAAARGRQGQSEMRSMSTVVETRSSCAKAGGKAMWCTRLTAGTRNQVCHRQHGIRQEGLGLSTMLSEGGQTLANLEPAVVSTLTWYGICYSTQRGGCQSDFCICQHHLSVPVRQACKLPCSSCVCQDGPSLT